MLTELGEVRLRNGQAMSLRMLEPPQEDLARRLLHFLEHKDDDSYRGIKQRLQGMYVQHCLDRYFVGEVEGRIVGQAWYGLPLSGTGVGNFGHVYTEPEWRGQSVAHEIVRVLVDHFMAEPLGQCLLCSASAESGRIYRRFGFEFTHPGAESGSMALVKPEAGGSFAELEQRYFAPGLPVQVREGHIGHRHDLDRLMDFSPAWIEARRRWHFVLAGSTVPTYMAALHRVEDGRGLVTVLENEAGSIVGYAFVLSLGSPLEPHLLTCDFAVHPHYLANAETLLEDTLYLSREMAPAVYAFVAMCDETKYGLLQAVGFTAEYAFPDAFVLDGQPYPVLLLKR